MTAPSRRSDSATVKLHRALYTHDAIRRAASTFGEFASFTVRIDGEHFVVDLSEIDADVEGDVVAEFCNFALANTALRGKAVHD
jgi:hypothetical protein